MLELPPSSLAVEISGRLVLVTWRICLNAFIFTDGWKDRLVALCKWAMGTLLPRAGFVMAGKE